MSAQVTEAHKQLVATIVEQAFRFAEGNHKITPLSQLIADSEAKACAELRAELDAQCLLNAKGSEREAVLLGRVDRMAKECLNLRADLDAIKAIRNEETARAERAEEIADRYGKRAISLEAELAAERARLDYILRTCAAGVFYNAESRDAIDAEMKEENK